MSEQKRVVKIHCPGCGQKMDVSDIQPFTRISCPACHAGIMVPRVFAGITLEEPIAEGPRSAVYRALDPTLDREVIVKALPAGDENGEVFLAEARRAAAITHANVAPIYSCGVEEGQAYLVMQFLSGRDLGKWIAEAEPGGNPRFAMRVGLALTRALAAARRQELEHGHLVPRNVLLDLEGNVKLADFGLARSLAVGEIWHPEEYGYASPEALLGDPNLIGWRADLFSVGAIVHQLLSGQDPVGTVSSAQLKEARLAGQLPAEPARLVAGLPAGLSDLVMSLMAYRPDDRPNGYEEVVGAFRAFEQKMAKEAASHTRRVKPAGTRRAPVKFRAAEVAGRPVPVAPANPIHRLVNVGLVIAAIVLVVLMILLSTQHTTPPEGDRKPDANGAGEGAGAVPEPGVGETPDNPSAGAAPEATAPSATPAAADVAAADAQRRPHPVGLDFAAAGTDLDDYLRSLPAATRPVESERLDMIRESRQLLLKEMKYMPYQDTDEGILLADGRRLKGTIPMASEAMLQVRTENGNESIKWADIPFGQCVRMLDYYVEQRLTHADPDLSDGELAEQRRSIAGACLRNAVLCEWYGEPALGSRFARVCGETSPSLMADLRRLAPGTLAGN